MPVDSGAVDFDFHAVPFIPTHHPRDGHTHQGTCPPGLL